MVNSLRKIKKLKLRYRIFSFIIKYECDYTSKFKKTHINWRQIN